MLTNFFEKMDGLPVVRLLQLSAFVLFIAGVFRLVEDGHKMLGYGFVNDGVILNAIMLIQGAVLKSLYQPVFLLGLAEIIRIKEKREYNQKEEK